jgi:predicted Zn finger-like uncharacterized protein
MIIICEECGKKYQVDTEKIKGDLARVKCRSCRHVITVKKGAAVDPEPAVAATADASAGKMSEAPSVARPKNNLAFIKKGSISFRNLGLRPKMFCFFFAIPLIFVGASALLYLLQIKNLSTAITAESSGLLTKMGEDIIAENSRSAAKRAKMYLAANPDLTKEYFGADPGFSRIGLQKVGKTGYTAVYSVPLGNEKSAYWVSPNESLIGLDTQSALKKSLGDNFGGFWKVYSGAFEGRESKGYFNWKEPDGRIREKFMVCTAVEGTPYVVSAAVYTDELAVPAGNLAKTTSELFRMSRDMIFLILGVTLSFIGGLVSYYGYSLSGNIKALTEVADRISMGELDIDIGRKTNDEIGDLGEAITRMQESIRLAVERLRRR